MVAIIIALILIVIIMAIWAQITVSKEERRKERIRYRTLRQDYYELEKLYFKTKALKQIINDDELPNSNLYIQEILDKSETKVFENIFDKLTIVVTKLPNGYVLVGKSYSSNENSYDKDIALEIANIQIKDQLWRLEGYATRSRECKKDYKMCK